MALITTPVPAGDPEVAKREAALLDRLGMNRPAALQATQKAEQSLAPSDVAQRWNGVHDGTTPIGRAKRG